MAPVAALLRYPLFALLGQPVLEAWAQAGQRVRLNPGDTLLQAGRPGRHAYVLLQGRVRVCRPSSSGSERSLGILLPGDVFGEYALLPPHQDTASCRACEPGEAYRLPLAVLRLSLKNHRGVSGQLKSWLRLHALVSHFRRGAGLGFLSAPSLLGLFQRCREVTVRAAHTVQADGLLADGWAFLQRGEVAVHSEGAEPVRLGPGDCFGERALVNWDALPQVVALADTTCWLLPRDAFAEPVAGAPNSVQTFARSSPCPQRLWDWLPQRGVADCGVAALAMALRGQGTDVTFEQVQAVTPPGSSGVSLAALSRAAQALGVKASLVRVGLEQLPDARLPAVAHQTEGHYVALLEVRLNEVVLGDPARGVCTLPLSAFRQAWSGNLLLLNVSSGA